VNLFSSHRELGFDSGEGALEMLSYPRKAPGAQITQSQLGKVITLTFCCFQLLGMFLNEGPGL